MNETHRLLREFVEEASEPAFQELVRRYLDLVFSTALRRMDGDAHRAQDVAQTVFIDLARKAAGLPRQVMLGGWLHRHCCFVASNVRRSDLRRAAREQEAAAMNALQAEPEGGRDWERLAPMIDETIQELPAPDRDALVLRFFEKQDFRAIGAALGASEDTAQKRTTRALEKLRHLLGARGVALSVTALDGLLLANSVAAAPAGWAGRIGASALEHAPVKSGMLAGLAALLSTTVGKVALGVLGVLLAGGLVWRGSRQGDEDTEAEGARAGRTNNASVAASGHGAADAEASPGSMAAEDQAISNALKLTIVSAESLAPLPGIAVAYRSFTEAGRVRRELVTGADGVCLAPIPTNGLIDLQLTTRAEGYADTRLLWHASRGQKVPKTHTLKLPRGTPISGLVLDAQGDPVAGAEVGFNHDDDPVRATSIESPTFDWITAQTDGAGRWKITRVAEEMVRRLRGGASHPEHVNSDYLDASRNQAAENELRKGTHVFHLGAAVSVRGVVKETGGTPIAQAKVLVGSRGMSGAREVVTELDGSFEARGVKPGPTLVTAEAPQYAPTTVSYEAATNAEPVELVLARGQILKLRVVNAGGQAVPNAHVGLNTFSRNRRRMSDAPEAASQANFRATTDMDGRVLWDQAPDEELVFNAGAVGFMLGPEIKVRPDGLEHTVVLQPALRVSGTVRDAETGAAIPNFKLIAGWPDGGLESGRVAPHWSPMDRFWLSFGEGQFEHVYEEPVIHGTSDPEFMFKIEAEGYTPFVSRVVKANEGAVTFDVALAKGGTVEIQVLNPDGTPATNTDLAFAGPMEQVNLSGSGFSSFNGGAVLTTDAMGQVRWQPDDLVVQVFAANGAGFAQKTPAELRADPTLQLQAWGRAEVTIQKRGRPVANRKILAAVPNRDQKMPWLHISEPTPTDAQGKAVLPKVPPGKFDLAYLSRSSFENESYTHVNFDEMVVRPGETTVVNHRIEGLDVRVRMVWPEGHTRAKTGFINAMVRAATPIPPAEIQGDPAKVQQWMQLPENQEAFRKARQFPLAHKEADIWMSSDVPPGEYSIFYFSGGPARPGEPPPPSIQGSRKLIVPDEFEGEVFDAGELVLSLFPPPGSAPR